MPADGRLGWTEYQPGRFDPAFLQSAKKFNEQRWYGFEGSGRKFVVVQIAGLVARRIVSWIKPEAVYARGERLGMIAFGSEVDLYLPLGVELTVRPGQRVRAGETVVGKWR
jgi:phosphatidylserine decarboxylase